MKPVEAATEDVIERAAEVIHRKMVGLVRDEEIELVADDGLKHALARALAAAGLLAGGVPGRSEAEIEAVALNVGDVVDVTLTLEIGNEEEDWIEVGPAGDAWPDVDGWWIPRAMIHRATDPLPARVAGTTEAVTP